MSEYQPEPQSLGINTLLSDIESGRIKVPQFQRKYVWNRDKAAKLVDSILKGYPIGTFIIWNTRETLRYVKNIGNLDFKPTPKGDAIQYVLDGQQRITSLFAALKGVSISRDGGITDNFAEIGINLAAPYSSDTIVEIHGKDRPSGWISVKDLFEGDIEALSNYPKSYHAKIGKYRDRLRSYQFSTIVVRNAPIETATEIFTRINVTGRPLSVFEIMVAKTFDPQKNFDLAEKHEELMQDLSGADYGTLPDITILQIVSAIVKKECATRDILGLKKTEFIDNWDLATSSLKEAVEYFRSVYRIPVSHLLPYRALSVPFAYYFSKVNRKPRGIKAKYLEDFFWRVSLGGRYSASLESKLARDLLKMDAILDGQHPDYEWPVDLSTEFIWDNGYFKANRSYAKAALCLLAYQEPKSFLDGSLVNIRNDWLLRANSKNYHHFFPKAFLQKEEWSDFEINHVANITIVDDYLNKREIRAKAPSKYMREFKNGFSGLAKVMRNSHLINPKEDGVYSDNYERFTQKRLERFAEEFGKRILRKSQEKQTQEINYDDVEEGFDD